jgi:type II secretory pathway predicted ATPase ExeA
VEITTLLRATGKSQADLARAVGVSPATITQIVKHGHWPKRWDRGELQGRLAAALREMGAEETAISSAFETAGESPAIHTQETDMLLAAQRLTQEARRAFGLPFGLDPFGPVTSPDQTYLTADIRYAREALWSAAINADMGTLSAIVGESGAGKSTLRRDLKGRIAQEGRQIAVIEPYVLGMDSRDDKGGKLRVGDVAQRIIRTLAPEETVRRSQDARFEQLQRVLTNSANAGWKHLVIIEEAHALPKATLRHLKRLVELEHGMKFLCSVVLMGQTELRTRLSETDPEIREVVQRCGVATLEPLTHAGEYLRARLAPHGIELGKLINPAGLAALETRLGQVRRINGRSQDTVSLMYPLACQNLLIACLNQAARLGFEVVDADVVQGV